MNAPWRTGWHPLISAFIIWFTHFMLCWVAVEIWPRQWYANASAWGLTALALLALGWLWVHLQGSKGRGELVGWTHGVGKGAVAIAGLAIVFTAVPSVVFLP